MMVVAEQLHELIMYTSSSRWNNISKYIEHDLLKLHK